MSVDQHEQMIDLLLNRQIKARDLDELAQLSQTQPEALVRIAAAFPAHRRVSRRARVDRAARSRFPRDAQSC